MKVSTLYGIVIKTKDGGETMNSFMKEESAIKEGERITQEAKELSEKGKIAKGLRIYLSELDYSIQKNRILSNHLIDENSKLLFESL